MWDAFTKVYEYCNGEKFIFVLDEWDYIYHQDFASDGDKESFTKFLSSLLKDNAYVEMAYMTGILPIAKYSSGSELNMFFEFSMAASEAYSEFFGFTDEEVDAVKEDVALMVADNPVPAKIQEYAASSMELRTRDEI